jgi:hypothetical protein
MRNEWNRATGVCGNETVNTLVLVLNIELWLSSETCGHHELNVVCPHSLRDIWWSEILPNCHVIQGWKLAFSNIFFLLSFAPRTKNHTTYMLPINYFLVNEKWNFNIWNKKNYPDFDLT